ncbi:zinc finger protein 235 isoform X2 [Scophthalmus maximus]|uniref:zinc finger protein 235 isoform X2 n=1 Tax=Scophthalmus maximus TaxID=52904 RepID=UPI0015E0E2BE|nr:zinc finger protein 235 isoform X2 [Scophthalmus maximus]
MIDFITFKTQVTSIVDNLAKSVMAEIFTATEKMSLNKTSPETEMCVLFQEKMAALLDGWCVEAVDKILQMFEVSTVKPPETGRDAVIMETRTHEGLRCDAGADGGGKPRPSGQTYFLEYKSDVVVDRCLLVAPPGNDHGSSPSPPPNTDHEYARLPSPPPGVTAAAVKGQTALASSMKRRRSRRKKETYSGSAPASDTHHQCSMCAMLFPNAQRFADHQRKSHPRCLVCGTQLSGILKLHEHEIREHGLLPYACDHCPKRFNHKAHRDLHVKARHTGEKSVQCDVCGKGYSCVSVLKTHRVTHFDKTFVCDVCGKNFFHACHLTRHKLVHQNVRPHRCSTCGKGFNQAANLRSHQAVHSGERQLCSVCGKSFRRLNNHIISKHSHELSAHELPAANAVVTCDVCGKKFPNVSQFRVHQRSHTGEKACGRSHRATPSRENSCLI